MSSSFRAYVTRNIPGDVERFLPHTPTEFVKGDLVFLDTATDTLRQCGADPALILGVAEVDAASSIIDPEGRVPVRILTPDTVVAMSSASVFDAAQIGNSVDIVDTAPGIWRMLLTTSNPRVLIRGGVPAAQSLDGTIWFVQFIAANLQFDAIAS